MSNERYFNFPIQLLAGFLTDRMNSLTNIYNYATYKKAQNLKDGSINEWVKYSDKYFGIITTDPVRSFENGLELYENLPISSPMVGINKSVYFDYYLNDKDEFEEVCLLAFLAIKSIVQNKSYCKIDNDFLLSRMDGNTKKVMDYSSLSPEIVKYANNYQIRKIKAELCNSWGLVTYSRYTRGFYVSFTLSVEELVFEAEKRRKSTKAKQAKEREKEAVKIALHRLNGHDTTITQPLRNL